MLRAIIVDDVENIRKKNKAIIEDNCPQVSIIGEAWSVESSIDLIIKLKPDLVFLDIEMEDGTGFDILKKIENRLFKVIFITGHQNFAIDAFRFSAIDYLIKPLDTFELKQAVDKVKQQISYEDINVKFNTLLQNLERPFTQKKIVLKTSESIHSVATQDIIRCEADKNYTTFFLINGKKLITSITLKEYDKLLAPHGFFRVQQSHLINMIFFDHYLKKDGGTIILKDNSQIPVSSAKREELLKYIEQL